MTQWSRDWSGLAGVGRCRSGPVGEQVTKAVVVEAAEALGEPMVASMTPFMASAPSLLTPSVACGQDLLAPLAQGAPPNRASLGLGQVGVCRSTARPTATGVGSAGVVDRSEWLVDLTSTASVRSGHRLGDARCGGHSVGR